MEDIQNQGSQDPKLNLDPQEVKAEEEALKESSDDEIQTQIIEKYGLDKDVDSALVKQLVTDKKDEQKRLSTAIKQKRGWRDKAHANPIEQKKEVTPEGKSQPQPKVNSDDIEKRISARFEERDLSSFGLSEELTKEVKSYAIINNVSIKKAFDSPYIQFRKGEDEKQARIDEASIGGKHRVGQAERDFSKMKPGDFDRSTKEGRKEYAKWKVQFKAQNQ